MVEKQSSFAGKVGAESQVMYDLLFRCAAAALQELAGDPRFVGGQIGMVGVLHTLRRAQDRPGGAI